MIEQFEHIVSERIEEILIERSPDMKMREETLFETLEKLVRSNEGKLQEELFRQTDQITDCLAEGRRHFYVAGLEDGIRIMKMICRL